MIKFVSRHLTKNLFQDFFDSEKTGGIILLIATIISLVLSNFILGSAYIEFWDILIFGHTIVHWVNDGLMVVFFLLVGLELEREIYVGELSNIRNALLPIIAAIGGMLVPALIHFLLNQGANTQSGAGIPTATDIAFSLGVLSLFGKKVPLSLKIFLTALAIADDLGAIFIIAIFYTKTIVWIYLISSLGVFLFLILMNRLRVKNILIYILGGIVMWFFMLHSGVHPTITGVLLAFAIPFTKKDNISAKIQHKLHIPVAYFILPIFALANTCIVLEKGWLSDLFSNNSLGIFLGLTLGKPIGIVLFSLVAIFSGVALLPSSIKWKHIIGAGFLAGIGFTMSIFVSGLAFEDSSLIKSSQIVVLIASLMASLLGIVWFKFFIKTKK